MNKQERHHENYNNPLNVVLLCRKCHILRHKSIEDFKTTITEKGLLKNENR